MSKFNEADNDEDKLSLNNKNSIILIKETKNKKFNIQNCLCRFLYIKIQLKYIFFIIISLFYNII